MSKIKIFALGGLNENGKNMYVVEVNKDIFVFDAGLKYDNDINLGIDYIIPNIDYLIKNRKKIKGIFLTPFKYFCTFTSKSIFPIETLFPNTDVMKVKILFLNSSLLSLLVTLNIFRGKYSLKTVSGYSFDSLFISLLV